MGRAIRVRQHSLGLPLQHELYLAVCHAVHRSSCRAVLLAICHAMHHFIRTPHQSSLNTWRCATQHCCQLATSACLPRDAVFDAHPMLCSFLCSARHARVGTRQILHTLCLAPDHAVLCNILGAMPSATLRTMLSHSGAPMVPRVTVLPADWESLAGNQDSLASTQSSEEKVLAAASSLAGMLARLEQWRGLAAAARAAAGHLRWAALKDRTTGHCSESVECASCGAGSARSFGAGPA
jgi:hypothetical protein